MRWLLVMVLLASSVAIAQPEKIKAEAAARDGQQRYQAGEYQLAAERFELAYELDPDPAYLFNLAQAYRLGNQCAKSAAAYRKLLGIVSSGPNVAKVEQYVQQMDACAKTQAPVTPTAPPPPVEESRPVPPPLPVAKKGNAPFLYAGIGVTTLGVVALAVGGLAMKKVADLEAERERVCVPSCTWSAVKARADALDADGHRYQRRMLIGYIGGGLAVGAGIALILLSRESSERPPVTSIAPTNGGAMAFGTFAF
jgi:tetratricopeptide (TPR) repeat protein